MEFSNKQTAVLAIKKHLWGLDYKVEQVDHIPGVQFNLLVDGKFRVLVLSSNGEFDPDPSICDVVAYAPHNNIRQYMFVGQPATVTSRASEIFRKEVKKNGKK